jgi:type I restriction enzyme S subunit
VQPQIGQDELLAIPIPQAVVDRAEELLQLMTAYEDSIRSAKRLVLTSKRLVEALIEGVLAQQQLIDAQKALATDDANLDRDILSRLTTEGMDGDGDPLFPDLGELYDLLAQSQRLNE